MSTIQKYSIALIILLLSNIYLNANSNPFDLKFQTVENFRHQENYKITKTKRNYCFLKKQKGNNIGKFNHKSAQLRSTSIQKTTSYSTNNQTQIETQNLETVSFNYNKQNNLNTPLATSPIQQVGGDGGPQDPPGGPIKQDFSILFLLLTAYFILKK